MSRSFDREVEVEAKAKAKAKAKSEGKSKPWNHTRGEVWIAQKTAGVREGIHHEEKNLDKLINSYSTTCEYVERNAYVPQVRACGVQFGHDDAQTLRMGLPTCTNHLTGAIVNEALKKVANEYLSTPNVIIYYIMALNQVGKMERSGAYTSISRFYSAFMRMSVRRTNTSPVLRQIPSTIQLQNNKHTGGNDDTCLILAVYFGSCYDHTPSPIPLDGSRYMSDVLTI
ncbi:hypothetical protein F5B21DRAFT_510136 [Xylaria acuta]|nr:hypothetical protein F5B21DRAFT_510136 [Xylaria acuta]